MHFVFVFLALFAAMLPAGAAAQTLVIGAASGNTSLDPLFQDNAPNLQVSAHIFDRLVDQDERLALRPALATAWRALADTTWEFELREGVRFHDGAPFTADDVVASLQRVAAIENSPASFAVYTRPIARVEVVSPHRIRFHTAAPFPLLPEYLSQVNIVGRAQAGLPTAEFNAGRAVVGTGPFRFVAWTPGERLELARNPDWWGGAPAWERVVIRFISNDAARIAALLTDQVQVIDAVPTGDAGALGARGGISLFATPGIRIISLGIDSARERAPFVFGPDNEPIANPLRDRRVRLALAMAINREAIVTRLHAGQAVAASQLVREGMGGFAADIAPPPFDPEGARRLLAEAGWPRGFSLTLHGPANRFPNDEETLQAIAAMFARIGVRARVETMPNGVFLSRYSRLEFAVAMQGFSPITGEASSALRGLLATFDRERGDGTSNRSRYSNPALDAPLQRALVEMDRGRREALLQQAMRAGMEDVALIPLYFSLNVWATRQGLAYTARADDQTRAVAVRRTE